MYISGKFCIKKRNKKKQFVFFLDKKSIIFNINLFKGIHSKSWDRSENNSNESFIEKKTLHFCYLEK